LRRPALGGRRHRGEALGGQWETHRPHRGRAGQEECGVATVPPLRGVWVTAETAEKRLRIVTCRGIPCGREQSSRDSSCGFGRYATCRLSPDGPGSSRCCIGCG